MPIPHIDKVRQSKCTLDTFIHFLVMTLTYNLKLRIMKLFIIVLFGLSNSFIISSQDDSVYYAKITNTRTYMNIDRVSVTEYWFTRDKSCMINNQVKSIVRKDIGVSYLICLQAQSGQIQ
jgi:hypothetical protein